ncbi:MAG: M3 family oligoendopeptidase, partial [Oscillospiraceae bacterium]|nr:M3 family oligoendopeptidase [Oscillospiraceae bacterium]
MKFSEFPYTRPDVEALKARIEACTAQVRAAASAAEQIALVDAMVEEINSVESMGSLAYVRNTINTKDAFYDAERNFFDEVGPELEEKTNALYAALLDSPYRAELEAHYGQVFMKNLEIARRSFTPELIPLMQEASKLESQYQKLYAGMTVEFDGKTMPLPMLGPYKQSTDRAVRKAAYETEGCF